MKLAVLVSLIGLLVGFLVIGVGFFASWYSTTPLNTPITLASSAPQIYEFSIGRRNHYQIQVQFPTPEDPDALVPILGNGLQPFPGKLQIEWDLTKDGHGVAHGSNGSYGYSPFWGSRYEGITIGSFQAPRGAGYALRITPTYTEPGWDSFAPEVAVTLHPSQLEYTLIFILIGTPLVMVFGTASLCCIAVLLYRRLRMKIGRAAGS